MKLNYLLAAAPFAASVIAAPSPEGNTTPLDLETRDGDVIGRISSTACGDVTQLKGKAPTTVNNQWFMFTYETTCKDGTKISITADQSCTQDSFWESIKKAFTFNLAPFNVDSGDYKGQMEVDIDLVSVLSIPSKSVLSRDVSDHCDGPVLFDSRRQNYVQRS